MESVYRDARDPVRDKGDNLWRLYEISIPLSSVKSSRPVIPPPALDSGSLILILILPLPTLYRRTQSSNPGSSSALNAVEICRSNNFFFPFAERRNTRELSLKGKSETHFKEL